MNFNFNNQPEYNIYSNASDELINLYGVKVKFVFTEQMNKDNIVFGDFGHYKTNNKSEYIYILPENMEEWNKVNYQFTPFGLINSDNMDCFISRKTIESLFSKNVDLLEDNIIKKILNNFIIMPNQKIMEITDVKLETPGMNNLFTFNNTKSVYRISLIPYNNTLINEVKNEDITYNYSDEVKEFTNIGIKPEKEEKVYNGLDKYFEELLKKQNEIELNANVDLNAEKILKSQEVEVIEKQEIKINDEIVEIELKKDKIMDVKEKTSIVDFDELNVFGEFK